MTPGTPNTPTIIAFKGLIAMVVPNKPPIKLKKNKTTPPIIAFINSLINILIGITNNIPTIYNNSRPAKYAKIVVGDILSPLYFTLS